MKSLSYLFILFLLTTFQSCSTSTKTIAEKDVSVSTLFHKSSTSNLFYKLPNGWREIEDNDKQIFELWLISKNNNSTITFLPLHLDSSITKNDIQENLRLLYITQKKIKQSTLKSFEIVDKFEEFSNNEITFITMKYLDDGMLKQSVIFGRNKSFYECSAYFKDSFAPTDIEIGKLFEIQKIVLLSLQMK